MSFIKEFLSYVNFISDMILLATFSGISMLIDICNFIFFCVDIL